MPAFCPPPPDDLPRARRVEANLPEKFCSGRVMDTKDPDGRVWRIFLGDEHERKVDLSAIEPYARVISHGGTVISASGQEDGGLHLEPPFPVCSTGRATLILRGDLISALLPFPRPLRRRPERRSRFCFLLPARKQRPQLSLHHGEPVQVTSTGPST